MNQIKPKSIFKNQYFILTILTLLGLFLRIYKINPKYGLWYDEMLTYLVASNPFPMGIINKILQQDFHMPLYYFYVHFWMKLFGTSDVALKLSSVFWGVLTIPAFFSLGKELKSKQLGYLAASIACLSPILIFYSQEFRFYSMLIFFTTLSVIYFLKLLNNSNAKNFFLFGISNLVILYIYTMGIIFVGTEILLLFIHFWLYKKDSLKSFFKFIFIFFVCSIFYLFLFISYFIASKNVFAEPFLWFKPNLKYILMWFNDFFSPVMTNLMGPKTILFNFFLNNLLSILLLIFLITPSLCMTVGFICGLRSFEKKHIYLFIIMASFLLTEFILCFTNSFIFISRYTIIIIPILLLLCLFGILNIKYTIIKRILISLIFAVYIFNAFYYQSTQKLILKPIGSKSALQELNNLNLNKNDYILYTGCGDLLKKYFNKTKFIDFSINEILFLDKTKKEALKLFDEDFVKTTNRKNAMIKFIPYLMSNEATPQLKSYLDSQVKQIPVGRLLIFMDSSSHAINIDFLHKYVKDNLYKEDIYKEQYRNLITDKINHDIEKYLDEVPTLIRVQSILKFQPDNKSKVWRFVIYKKV